MITKICRQCLNPYAIDKFGRDKRSRDGHYATCLYCQKKNRDAKRLRIIHLAATVQLVRSTTWEFGHHNAGDNGYVGRVALCSWNGYYFYTRENLTAIPSFNISSGERWGEKMGSTVGKHRQSLELLAPKEHWQEIADIVHKVDPLHRPVIKTRSFTVAWAKKQFKIA